MKKVLTGTCAFLLLTFAATAQEAAPAGKPAADRLGMWYFTLGPTVYINTARAESGAPNSAPSPVLLSGGFGADIRLFRWLYFSPHVSFFMNYHLWNGTAALPAEVEHRTGITPSLMFDLPLTAAFQIQNMVITAGLGVGILARYSFMAQGVPEQEAENIKNINLYFWDNMRWFYPSLQASFDYIMPNGMGIGAGARVYLPLPSSLREADFVQNMLISVSFRLHLPAEFSKKTGE